MVKVIFELGDNEWHGHSTESLNAEEVSKNLYRILNNPFYAKGVSFQDLVHVHENEVGQLVFDRVADSSGHSTYRIIVNHEAVSHDKFESYWKPLSALGCVYESNKATVRLYSVDVPPQVNIHKAYELLQKGLDDGVWEFEEAKCAHKI